MPEPTPEGYLGSEGRITSGPAPELVRAGYEMEIADAPLLHRGLGLADLAHLIALHKAGVVPSADAAALAREVLRALEMPAAEFPYDARYGDAYNSREREFERRLGPVAGWLHTGRTRREAGRIAFRLALRDRLLALHAANATLTEALCRQQLVHATTIWADNTYLQPAQPSTFGHYLGAFADEAARHLERIQRAFVLADRSPAGAGGVGGPRVPLDRAQLADLLGFGALGSHTRDAMWSIDAATDAALTAAHTATTADRLAEDLEIYTSPGFGYVTLAASMCRASVLMPQKRNPYALAVIRSGASTLIGRATGLMVTARTPSARTDNWLNTYRETTDALVRAHDLLALTAEVVRTLQVDATALASAAAQHFTGAADLAEELVLRCGIDYRSAYRVVARAVARAGSAGAATLTAEDLTRAAATVLGRDLAIDDAAVAKALDAHQIVATRTVPGGSAPERVREHALATLDILRDATKWREHETTRIERAERELLVRANLLAD